LYVQPYGRAHLNNLTGTPQYVNWITGLLRPYLGDNVLELGAGIGTLSGRLMGRRMRYVACESDSLYLHALRNRFLRTPSVEIRELNPASGADYESLEDSFDTVLCVNVLEYLEEPDVTLAAARRCLKPGGRLLLLAPQGRSLFGSLDRTLGHKQRFSKADLRTMLEAAGFTLERSHHLNKIATPAWWVHSRLLRKRYIGKPMLKLFDKSVWFWKTVDPLLPWPGLTAVVVARKPIGSR
jgi:SAM-dependent methyltransferase